MINKRNYNRFAKVFIFLIITVLGFKEIYHSQKYSNRLSQIADDVTEAVVLRAGECYAKNGFLSNAGLPDYWCGCNQFTEHGSCSEYFSIMKNKAKGGIKKAKLSPDAPPWAAALSEGKYIKTHYPPGPHWLTGLYTKICGLGNLGCFRLFPTTFGIFSLFLFALILLSNFDPVKSAIFMFTIAVIPTTSNTMHGLDLEGYTLSLFLIQLGLFIAIFKKKVRLNTLHLSVLFLLGFIQGWLSFDFIILVSLSALPFSLLYSPLDQKGDRKRLFLAIIAPAIGFLFAHILHFIQVSIYYGSVFTAYKDIFEILSSRYEDQSTMEISRIKMVWDYLFRHTMARKFFIINVPVILILVSMLLYVKEATLYIQKPLQITLRWVSHNRNFYVILAAFFVSTLLMFIMKQLFYYHPHIHTRHLFLLYFMCILTVLECVSLSDLNIEKQE